MNYSAVVRRKGGSPVFMRAFRAFDIYQASEIVRVKHGLHGDDPHKGFTINQSLPTTAIKEGN